MALFPNSSSPETLARLAPSVWSILGVIAPRAAEIERSAGGHLLPALPDQPAIKSEMFDELEASVLDPPDDEPSTP